MIHHGVGGHPAVHVQTDHLAVIAQVRVPAATVSTIPAPLNADDDHLVPCRKIAYCASGRLHRTRELVAERDGWFHPLVAAARTVSVQVAAADSAAVHPDKDFLRAGLWHRHLTETGLVGVLAVFDERLHFLTHMPR